MPRYDPHNTPPYSGGPRPGTVKLRTMVKERWPAVNVGYPFGIYAARPSEHGAGRALDAGLNASNAAHRVIAEEIKEWAVENADKYGIQSVIWNRRVWGFGRWYWRDYTGPSPHTDHIHIGQNLIGAMGNWDEEDEFLMALSETEQKDLYEKVKSVWKDHVDVKDGKEKGVLESVNDTGGLGAVLLRIEQALERIEAKLP